VGGAGVAALSRRRALKSVGLAATACASASIAQFSMSPRLDSRRPESSSSLRGGILLPRSRSYHRSIAAFAPPWETHWLGQRLVILVRPLMYTSAIP